MTSPLRPLRLLAVALGLTVAVAWGAASSPPERVSFWHYLGYAPAREALEGLAADFNRSQGAYRIEPLEVGSHQALATRTIAALRSGGPPAMAMVDNAFFTRLALGGRLLALDTLVADLPPATVADFYPVLWDYGEVRNARLGLPWAASTLLLYYNADALRARGVSPPRSWEEFARAARALTGRGTKGAVWITDGWIFASLVASRGGSLLTGDARPSLDGPAALESLRYLADLNRAGALIPRTFAEADTAVLDFLRTKAFMVVAPSSALPVISEYALAFKLGAVALPGRTLAGEAQLVVFKEAAPAAARGATEFWRFLVRPENLARWAQASGYLPARRSAARLLGEGATAAVLGEGLTALERAQNLPPILEFNDWRLALEAALERSLKGGADPREALGEAQRATGR